VCDHAAAQRQENSTTVLQVHSAASECRRPSFSERPVCLSAPAAVVSRHATFRPVVVDGSLCCRGRQSLPAGATLYDSCCDDDRQTSTSDDESLSGGGGDVGGSARTCSRKRHHDSSSDDALTSDDDNEIRTILMTSRSPSNGVVMATEKRQWTRAQQQPRRMAAVVNDCSVVHRPSLNLYKMQVS